MKLLIFGANWYNRGDEAAIRAMIDEFEINFSPIEIRLLFNQPPVEQIPYSNIEHMNIFRTYRKRNVIRYCFSKLTLFSHGEINLYLGREHRKFKMIMDSIKWADFAVYAPGGPCIGDIYQHYMLLDMIDLLNSHNVKYAFFAPSMGPFNNYKYNERITKMLKNAACICLREEISQSHIKKLVPNVETFVTLDAAFMHAVNYDRYEREYRGYKELWSFIENNKKVVGITITDLLWHGNYRDENEISLIIKDSFKQLIHNLHDRGYGVVFIPQLFGINNDKDYMQKFAIDNCFVMDDTHDCYFQQHLISKLYAVVGMRYHSNIFACKMGIPFIAIAYEHKTKGFMERIGKIKYCIPASQLSPELLLNKFEFLEQTYDSYKNSLIAEISIRYEESYETMKRIISVM